MQRENKPTLIFVVDIFNVDHQYQCSQLILYYGVVSRYKNNVKTQVKAEIASF